MQLRLSQTRIVTLGGRSSPLADDIEMGVEGRDLVDLRHRDLELFGQRVQVPLGQAALLVLDEVQVFDQQRALARPVAQQRLDGSHLLLPQHPPARKRRRLAAAGARMDRPAGPAPRRCCLLRRLSCFGSLWSKQLLQDCRSSVAVQRRCW